MNVKLNINTPDDYKIIIFFLSFNYFKEKNIS